jgi:hypothetical protein
MQLFLCSVWALKQEITWFQLHPKVLDSDTTLMTNSESHPYLMVCGNKDVDGHVYPFIQIFLCSELGWQFWWPFSYVLPHMVGQKHMSHVRMVITDGDFNEYTQLDAAIQQSFPKNCPGLMWISYSGSWYEGFRSGILDH